MIHNPEHRIAKMLKTIRAAWGWGDMVRYERSWVSKEWMYRDSDPVNVRLTVSQCRARAKLEMSVFRRSAGPGYVGVPGWSVYGGGRGRTPESAAKRSYRYAQRKITMGQVARRSEVNE